MIIKSISKIFFRKTLFQRQSVKVLKNINFSLNEGDIFGITGPNGAEKLLYLKLF